MYISDPYTDGADFDGSPDAPYWFDRRNGQWHEFDLDPRRSYYKFLRAVYQMPASQAWKYVQGQMPPRH